LDCGIGGSARVVGRPELTGRWTALFAINGLLRPIIVRPRQYILFDNFCVDGDVSADGHLWSTAGTSTEYVNKIWPMEYSKRAPGVLDAPYDGDAAHDHPVAAPQSGFLWDRLIQARKNRLSGTFTVPTVHHPWN